MSYVYEPDKVNPAYRPIMFRNVWNTTSAAEQVRVEVKVYGNTVATYRKPYWLKSGNDYFFDIDIQSVVQRFLAPRTDPTNNISGVFGSLTAWEESYPTDAIADCYINTYIEVRNANGLLEQGSSAADQSSTVYAVGATRPAYSLDLSEHYYASATGDIKFLTDGPTAQDVGQSENFGLCAIFQGYNAAQYKFYDSANSLYATTTVQLNAGFSASNPSNLLVLATGPGNVTNFSGTELAGSDSMPSAVAIGDYYTVTLGYSAGDASAYNPMSETRRLNVVGRCSHAIRLEWFNNLGGVDQYTFEGQVIKRHEHKGDVQEVNYPWDISASPPMNSARHGLLKTGIESIVKYEVTEVVDYEIADMVRRMASSPEVFMQVSGVRIPVAIEPGDNPIDISTEGTVELTFTIIAEQEITQEI